MQLPMPDPARRRGRSGPGADPVPAETHDAINRFVGNPIEIFKLFAERLVEEIAILSRARRLAGPRSDQQITGRLDTAICPHIKLFLTWLLEKLHQDVLPRFLDAVTIKGLCERRMSWAATSFFPLQPRIALLPSATVCSTASGLTAEPSW
jgi:hypothetical protein